MGVDNPGTLLRNDWRLCHSSSPCLLSVFVPTDGFVCLAVCGGLTKGVSQREKTTLSPTELSAEVFVVLNNGSYVDHDW